jgi:PAS domain S-box-containing protein
MTMFADLLEEFAPQLTRRLEASHSPPPGKAAKMVAQLVRTLRGEPIEVFLACKPRFNIGFDAEGFLRTLGGFKQLVYQLMDEREGVTAHEARLTAEWFSAMTELALRETNRRFSALLDALPDHVLLNDLDGRLVYMNRAAAASLEELAGRPSQSLIGRTIYDLAVPQRFKAEIARVHERARNGEAVSGEIFFPEPKGGRWRERHIRPLLDADGHPEGFTVASRDIHERKIAEARLELLSRVGTLAEIMDYEGVIDAVARISIPELADWCIVDIVEGGRVRRGTVAHGDSAKAPLAGELLRFSPELYELPLGRHVLTGRSYLIADVAESGGGSEQAEFHALVRRLDAQSAMILPFVVLGKPVAVATFVRTRESGRRYGKDDLALAQEMARRAAQIIENARLHEQLRQSEARFRVALAHSKIAVFEEDADFRVRWMYNEKLGPIDATPEIDALKRRVLETGAGVRATVDATVGGERRHLLVDYEPLRGAFGVVGITGAAVDITEAKRVQDELARELDFRERMVGVLGHDLRNPVSAVLGLSALLQQREEADGKTREGLQRIELAARRMSEMIATLLDFTQVRARGELPLSVESVDLDALSRAVVDELRAAHPGREISVESEGDVHGRWDSGRTAQVVSNLVANALTHGAGDAAVRLSLIGSGDGVALCVTNRGPTISPELAARMFEPFEQGSRNGEAPRARGLGLGLFIVREVVRAHGGTIDVRSDDDRTTFTVRLPRAA